MAERTAQRLTKPEEYAELLDRFSTFLFDCDGVIWTGPTLVPGMTDVLTMLRSKGKNILFVTNNAKKSREMYKKAFDGFGIQASVDEIFGSAYASAIYLSKILKFPADKKVYVIGEEGIEQELKSVGIQFTGGTVRSKQNKEIGKFFAELILDIPLSPFDRILKIECLSPPEIIPA
ncbi:hypothetical protein QFC24_005054 [Naganishia onofrii]|uniref:Uncharacterized protein n=1 Tax=Naganishia onofrii TaxID=1851511 RepID=A0ACC2XAM7_9TREE|nr:hypothetical protein QFC24_005054 [Naganishia onofrii]